MLPEQESVRRELVRRIEDAFARSGFAPIDTPVLEYAEILLGKGGGETDKQVYRFHDHGERDVAMRFDLTVPFARYMAQHRNELPTPFKRYHIAKVFRGENTQRGRYREFMQCDVDIVGSDSVSADLDILLTITEAFLAIGVRGVTIHLSHRGLFNRLLERLGAADRAVDALRLVDKVRKIGESAVRDQLREIVPEPAADTIMAFIGAGGGYFDVLSTLEELVGGPDADTERLRAIGLALETVGLEGRVQLDPSITRGLDYYTGLVFETFLEGSEQYGSVCSGGRYNDLMALYSAESLPGVGASIGLDRLVAALEERDALPEAYGRVHVLIAMVDEALAGHYHALASQLRTLGVYVDTYPEPRKLGHQFAYAEKRAIPWIIICGPDEAAAGVVNLRRMADRDNRDGLSLSAAAEQILEDPRGTP